MVSSSFNLSNDVEFTEFSNFFLSTLFLFLSILLINSTISKAVVKVSLNKFSYLINFIGISFWYFQDWKFVFHDPIN